MARNIVLGILAHVDAGKTTLTESMLLKSGVLRKAGRVDHRNSFLDTDETERRRGITIYDKNAIFTWDNQPFTVIDTPGHTDFAGETERALGVLDAAILVISAPNSVQSHTLTLWKLSEMYKLPLFIFVNKMDMQGTNANKILADLQAKLSPACRVYGSQDFYETAAESNEAALEKYLDDGSVDDETLISAVNGRKLFPVIFGSALNHEGTETLLDAIKRLATSKTTEGVFSAKIFRIARDPKGERLAFLKVMSGSMAVRTPIKNLRSDGEEKISSIRFYSGDKFKSADTAPAGSVCAVTGLKSVIAGDSIGERIESVSPIIEPVFTYRAVLNADVDKSAALKCFKILEEEDPLLRVKWVERYQEIYIQVMGEVALEILAGKLKERFGLDAAFDSGSILYKETILSPVNGFGHYEPLRHYAEVHLRLDPAPRGSGVSVRSEVSVDALTLNWQRLIFTHVLEKAHAGVLTGSPLTDVTVTLTAGRAHLKHTEGGDFRQATYRAIRQALMQAQNALLEPWYEMKISVPQEASGRTLNDISRMGGRFEIEGSIDGTTQITAYAPVRLAFGYQKELAAYTRGMGSMSVNLSGYEICTDHADIVAEIGYDAEHDAENPADSVFCSHGAGTLVKWDEAEAHMHIKQKAEREDAEEEKISRGRSGGYADENELRAIFERTYGKIERRMFDKPPAHKALESEEPVLVITMPKKPEHLLVDGYNIMHAWGELKPNDVKELERSRTLLCDIMDSYAAQTDTHVTVVFDAYKVKPNPGKRENYGNIEIVYTKEAQTADSYIEKLAHELSKDNRVRVATSDGLEQLTIMSSGALRMSATELKREIESANVSMRKIMDSLSTKRAAASVGQALEKAREGKTP